MLPERIRNPSKPSVHFGIRADTTKIESFHDFMNWIAFDASEAGQFPGPFHVSQPPVSR